MHVRAVPRRAKCSEAVNMYVNATSQSGTTADAFLTEDGFERKGKWRFSRKGSEIKMMIIINVTEMNGNHSGGDQKLSRPNRQAHRRGLQVQPDKGRLSETDESWQGV